MNEPGHEGAAVGGTEKHAQVDECGGSPLIRSFSELGLLAADDSAGWGAEEIRSRVEDVLSDYADCDVYVQVHAEPGASTLRIRTRGIGLPYPFTVAEVYETLDDLVETDLQISAEEFAIEDEDD